GDKKSLQCIEPVAMQSAERHHIGAVGYRLHLTDSLLSIVTDVGLVQENHAAGAARKYSRVVALQTPEIEIGVEPGNDEHSVDVGCDYLCFEGFAGGLAKED